MQFRISVALLLALAIAVGAGSVPSAGIVEGDGDGQVVAACETQRALVARCAGRVSLDCAPVALVAELSPDGSAWRGRGRALEPFPPPSFLPGAARLVTRTRGPPSSRA